MITPLKIAIWNANGLTQHIHELKVFIPTNDIDIMLVSETHFTNKSFINIPNYSTYHTMHPDGKAHGGTAVIIKSKIKHHEANKYIEEYLQATSVVVEDWSGSITISAIYCPPKHAIKSTSFEAYFKSLGKRFIVGGDFNAKHPLWGSRLTTTKGRELHKAIEALRLETVSTGEPTYWPTDRRKSPDVIDFSVIKGVSRLYFTAESCLELSSDHSPIILKLSSRIATTAQPCVLHNKQTNWSYFRNQITDMLDPSISLKTHGDIIQAVELFNHCVQQAAWNATPISSHKGRNISMCSTAIKEKITLKRQLRKQWQVSRSPRLKTKLNKATKDLKKMLEEERNLRVEEYLLNLNPTAASDYSLWKATRYLKQPQRASPPIRRQDGSWARSNIEKAATFATHLSKVFTANPREISLEEEDRLLENLDHIHQLELPIKYFTINEVYKSIQSMKIKKSPGYDLITGKVLQELPPNGFLFLTQLYNAILRSSFYPPQWKVAQIIMIQKPGKSTEDVRSYRPISLLPIASKLFEKLLLRKLLPVIEDTKLIPNHQFGFRQRHATVEQVHRIVNKIHSHLEAKRYCSAAFLDISQAFDKVWHDGLLSKLKRVLPINIYTILKSYLQNRYFLVKEHEAMSELHEISSGVPQGSVLGPILYLLYTADLPMTRGTTMATFADDTAILTGHTDPVTASKQLQGALNSTEKWLKKWRIKANETKSIHVTFTTRTETCPPVSLNNSQIPQSDSVKYLGMHLDRRLTWRKHIFSKRKQLGHQLSKLYWLTGRRSQLKPENKLLIYKSILKPVWTYGIQLWGTASSSNVEILQRFQSKVLRMIIDAPWFVTNEIIHKDLGVKFIKDEIKCYSVKYRDRLETHPNNLATNLMKERTTPRRLKRKIPQDLTK